MASVKKGPCLVSRGTAAVACPLADSEREMAERLDKLSLQDTKEKKIDKESRRTNPSDFVNLQSIHSSSLAKKTNTTSKFSKGPALLTDLLNREEKKIETSVEKKVEEKKTKEKDEKDEKNDKTEKKKEIIEENGKKENSEDGELLARAPIMHSRVQTQHHPYKAHGAPQYGAAALTTVNDMSAFSNFGSGYEVGCTWVDSPDNMGYLSQSSTPDSFLSDQGYSTSSHDSRPSPQTSLPDMDSSELGRLLNPTNELPDQLIDFILKFSRQYSPTEDTKVRPPSADSGVDSPMSARSAPNASPEVPHGGHSGPTTPSFNSTRLSPRKGDDRVGKQRLRALIPEHELDVAWAWALKTSQLAPLALTSPDNDLDTLLHIVTAHLDLGKIYSVVEHQLKTDNLRGTKPFDIPNRNRETPLFLAVMNRSPEVVDYLLEVGADPNVQTLRGDRDFALHYAAARGMNQITESLMVQRGVLLNSLNARGLTPLLVAVKNHGAIDEATQTLIDNRKCIVSLLKAGANPLDVEPTNGRTVVHYACEKMDEDLIDILRRNIEENLLIDLVNKADFGGEKPMHLLHQANVTEVARMQMIIPLLACGAEMK